MKLQKKTLLVVGLVWLGFIGIICASAHHLMLSGYLKAENEYAQRDLERVDRTFNEINYSLFLFTSDWAHWNDLYSYMQGKKPTFISDNLAPNVFKESTVNMLTFWDNKGKMVYGTGADTEGDQENGFSPDFAMPRTLLLNYPGHPNEIHGYVLSGDNIILAAASTITNGNNLNQQIGTMITGRILTPDILKKVDLISQTNLQIYNVKEIMANPALAHDLSSTIANKGHYEKPIDSKTLEGFTVIDDIFGKPIGFLRMIKTREIYGVGLDAFHSFVVLFALMGLLFSAAMFMLFRKLVLGRVEKLDSQIANIRAHKKIHNRVNVNGQDEVSSVATEFNALLDMIEDLHTTYAKKSAELKHTNAKLQTEISQYKKGDLTGHHTGEHFADLTNYDSLTSLPNRIFFNESLNKALSHAREKNETLSVIMLDIDKFKHINTAYGRQMGDYVLKEVSTRIASVLRPGDLLARLEGDEFILLLNDISHPKFASSIAEKLLQLCMQVIKVDGHNLFITASIGIAVYPNAADSLEDMVKNAEVALYKAKHVGGGVYQYFTQEMSHEKYEQLQLETALRKAIAENEFVLFYQPILNLNNGKICGVEALIRWMHPTLGLIDPINFIPFAEKTGLIIKIGEWVIREACQTNKRWQDEGYSPIPVSINLSPNQFKLQDISQLVTGILSETGLDPACLNIEITESAFLDDDKETVNRLNNIREMGVNVSIDDFGTGRFSLAYIRSLHITTIKIDKSLIKGIPEDQNNEVVASAIISMAHSLGVKIVAEGVETAEQTQYLFEQQCDMVQGYYISRPLPERKIVFLFSLRKDEVSA